MKDVKVGDIVKTKKTHPCGTDLWEVIRIGADIKIKCTECKRIIMLSRSEFDKKVKKVIGDK